MERTDQQPQQPTPQERAAAAELRADARARIDDITARIQTATTPQEHTALGRESASAWGDYKAAGSVLTEGGAA
jgi:predicted NAD-dependent protein-ADP-ribosyltransferase YbiA (DUF1768 family)